LPGHSLRMTPHGETSYISRFKIYVRMARIKEIYDK
jgi:hypothetical protein